MYLEYLRVVNYQSHEDTIIRFSPHFNVIHGRPNSGKTALFRAFKLGTTNRPLGGKFFSDFAGARGSAVVEYGFSDGLVITMEKDISVKDDGKFVNRTSFVMNGSEPASDLTEEMKAAINMAAINFQEQRDQPFLSASTPGEVAKAFSEAINIGESQEWTRQINAAISKTKANSESLKTQLGDENSRLELYAGVDGLGEKADEIDALDVKINAVAVESNRINEYLVFMLAYIEAQRHFESVTDLDAAADWIGEVDAELHNLGAERKAVDEYLVVQKANEGLAPLTNDTNLGVEAVFDIDAKIAVMTKEAQLCRRLEANNDDRVRIEADLGAVVEQYTQLIGETCPTCMRTITVGDLETLKDKLVRHETNPSE